MYQSRRVQSTHSIQKSQRFFLVSEADVVASLSVVSPVVLADLGRRVFDFDLTELVVSSPSVSEAGMISLAALLMEEAEVARFVVVDVLFFFVSFASNFSSCSSLKAKSSLSSPLTRAVQRTDRMQAGERYSSAGYKHFL